MWLEYRENSGNRRSILRAGSPGDQHHAMISIKRLLETGSPGAGPGEDLLAASLQMGRLLLEAAATHAVRGRESDYSFFSAALDSLKRRIDEATSPFSLLEIAGDAAESLEAYSRSTAAHAREQNEELQSMVSMLTRTVAEMSGLADTSVARLQAIEAQIERASQLDDLRALRASLEGCLRELREAAAQQRAESAASAGRLQSEVSRITARRQGWLVGNHGEFRAETPSPPPALAGRLPGTHVAVFKLLRPDHIAARFGRVLQSEVLRLVGQNLRTLLGPCDRLLRWKETAFVLFLNSPAPIGEIRARVAETIAAAGRQPLEADLKAAMQSARVDWIVFPQAQCPSLEAVFVEVDAFLNQARAPTAGPPP